VERDLGQKTMLAGGVDFLSHFKPDPACGGGGEGLLRSVPGGKEKEKTPPKRSGSKFRGKLEAPKVDQSSEFFSREGFP